MIRRIAAAFQSLLATLTGIYLYAIAAQHSFGNNQIHFFVIHSQNAYALTGERLAPRRLRFLKLIFICFAIQKVRNGKRKERLANNHQPAVLFRLIIPVYNHTHTEFLGKPFVIIHVPLVFRLCDKHMGQGVCIQQLQQAFKIMRLIAFNPKPIHQMINQLVIISPHFITTEAFRAEITGNAQLVRIIEGNRRAVVHNHLRNRNMRLKPLPVLTLKMNKTAHSMQKPPCNRNAKPKPAGKAAAACICLVKIIKHLVHLGISHTNTRIVNVDCQVDAITFLPAANADVDAAFFCKLYGIFHNDFQHMGNLLRVSHHDRRNLRVNIKNHFQRAAAALHYRHCNNVIQYRSNHIFMHGRRQSTFHNFRIVQHVVNKGRHTLACQLYRKHILLNLR